jgi:DNA repair protein RecN (Recombination protein N)
LGVLSELAVHNFAIIQHLQVSFQPGLNILSGETGAGKSILVGAVNLLLGNRASQEMIRTGSKEAKVEALFSIPGADALVERLNRWGLEVTEELLIRRTISRSGRNRIFVNDHLVTLQQLQELAKGLVSVSGQHEHQLLLDPNRHLELLDAFGYLESQSTEVRSLYLEWSSTREKLRHLRNIRKERADQMELMRFQLQELESAQLQPDEDKTLEQEKNILKHAATLMEASQRAHECLYAERGAVLEQLVDVEKDLETLKQIDSSQEMLFSHLEQARIHLEELAHSLQKYMKNISFDPHRLAVVEERLALIHRLSKKYAGPVSHLLDRMEEMHRTLAQEEETDTQEEQLEKSLEQLRQAYFKKAKALSSSRREGAEILAQEVAKTLAALDMGRARFSVQFKSDEESSGAEELPPGPTGIDVMEFLLAANPGEDLKPLAKIASGGELSRILLALKSLLSFKGEAETLIFDEVDAGIGGRTAELVGLQLKQLAERNQVICITHLPQIACYGKNHYKAAKHVTGEETITQIHALSSEERIEELARMLGGISISDKTRAHAKELLQRAQSAA